MKDRTISLGCVVAYGLWIATAALLMMGTVLSNMEAMHWALALSAASATATIRQYFVYHNRMMRNAFELGRDSRGVPVPPTRLRSET